MILTINVRKLHLRRGKNSSIKIKGKRYITCKIFYLLVYIFAVWEFNAENHLLMVHLKMSRDFVVRSSTGGSFHREALL